MTAPEAARQDLRLAQLAATLDRLVDAVAASDVPCLRAVEILRILADVDCRFEGLVRARLRKNSAQR